MTIITKFGENYFPRQEYIYKTETHIAKDCILKNLYCLHRFWHDLKHLRWKLMYILPVTQSF